LLSLDEFDIFSAFFYIRALKTCSHACLAAFPFTGGRQASAKKDLIFKKFKIGDMVHGRSQEAPADDNRLGSRLSLQIRSGRPE
jgi:hypothetical protein